MGCQLGDVAERPTTFTQGLAPQPGAHSDHMHGRRRQELLMVRARQPPIPTPAELNTAYALRETALPPRPQRILGCERRGPLALPCRLEHLMGGLWADRELAGGGLGGRARPAGGTRPAGRPVKPDAHDRVA
jgi:hypothetical protein